MSYTIHSSSVFAYIDDAGLLERDDENFAFNIDITNFVSDMKSLIKYHTHEVSDVMVFTLMDIMLLEIEAIIDFINKKIDTERLVDFFIDSFSYDNFYLKENLVLEIINIFMDHFGLLFKSIIFKQIGLSSIFYVDRYFTNSENNRKIIVVKVK